MKADWSVIMISCRNLVAVAMAVSLLVAFSGCCRLSQQHARPRPLFISHRGESSVAPENTMAAFRYAIEHGSDGFETDIHLTSDGTVVCSHDCNLKRVFGVNLKIEDHKYAELKGLVARPHADALPNEKAPILSTALGVPTLCEALSVLTPETKIFIEVKDNKHALVDAMARDIRDANLKPSQIAVISFHSAALKYCKEKYPEYKTLWLCGFGKDKKTGKYHHDVEYYVNVLNDIRADGIDCAGDFDFMTGDFYRAMRAAGMEVCVWTIDDTEKARRFVQDGVDGVTTNRAVGLISELRD